MTPASGMASCYFWCTHDGNLPQVEGVPLPGGRTFGSEEYRELLEELAPKQHEISLRPTQMEGKGGHAISTAFVYKISLSAENLEKINGEGNFSEFQYEFERHFSDCKFNFVCPSMSGQGCRDMWFQVRVGVNLKTG